VIARGDDEAEDEVLARRVMAGDRLAEAELCRRLAPRLRAFGRRHLGSDAAAGDLAHDVLILVLEKLRAGQVDAPERVASFALGACRRVASDLRRGQRRRAELLEQVAREDHVESAPSLDGARLAGCLEGLGPRERTVIAASFFAEESAESIAVALATSAGNVRVLRHRALRALRSCLERA
jgi:RNA polymerase sigma-70 factor (ECF subfamily)